MCWRHGAYRNLIDESTAFASCLGSEFEKTTVTHPSQRDSGSSSNQAAFPEEDIPLLSEKRWFCGAIVGAKFSTHRAEERQP